MIKKLYLFGDINRKNTLKLIKDINKYPKSEIYIHSDGGCPTLAMFIGKMVREKDIRVIGVGNVYSAATLIMASSRERCMINTSELMYHKSYLDGNINGNREELGFNLKYLNKVENTIEKYLKEINISTYDFYRKVKKDEYISPNEAKKLKLIDKII